MPVGESLAQLVGQQASNATLGRGTFFTLELGAWHLWIYNTAWRLEHGTKVVAASQDGRDHIEQALRLLDGRTVNASSASGITHDLTLELDGELVLRTFAIHATEHEHWMLYRPDDLVLVAGPGSEAGLIDKHACR